MKLISRATAVFAALSTLLIPSVALAEDAAPQRQDFGLVQMLLFMLPIVVLFWFLIIRPEKKRRQEHDKMVSELKKGDEVLTIGGIYGTIVEIREDRIILEISDKTRVKISVTAISSVVVSESESE